MQMRVARRTLCVLAAFVLFLASGAASARPQPASAAQALLFVENVGQFASPVRFQLGFGAATLYLADDGLWLAQADRTNPEPGAQRPAGVHLSFPGANPHPQLEPQLRLPTQVAYFVGRDPRGWHTNVPVWGGVRYRDLYPGVDLVLSSVAGDLDLQMIAQPGADLAAVRMRASGADTVAADTRFVRLGTGARELRLPLPRLAGPDLRPLRVAGPGPLVQGDTVSAPFARAELLPGAQLAAATPSIEYSSFYGSSGKDEGDAIAVGADGAAYIGGWTNASNFPGVTDTYGADKSGIEAVVIKLAPVPNAVPSYVVVAGGDRPDYVSGIAVDGDGAAYVVGYTASSNFPVENGFDTNGSGVDDTNRDTFVLKLSPDGSQLVYSTFAGGSADERGFEIDVDGDGAAYITGRTTSTDFPTTAGSFDTTANGQTDAYALKVSPQGGLAYGTYLGGGNLDQGNDIVVDSAGAAYVTGYAISSDFPVSNGFDASHNGLEDAFVVKLSASGAALEFGTFVGGADVDRGNSLAVDGAGAVYVAGYSLSANFPAQASSFDPSINGLNDVVVFKLAPNGKSLSYATYLGGQSDDFAEAIAVGSLGEAYVVGTTLSSDFPIQSALDSSANGSTDIFVAALSASGAALSYGSYLGGSSDDSADGMALDVDGALVLTGFSASSNFPTTLGGLDRTQNGDHDIILVRLALGAEPPQNVYTISGTITDSGNHPLANISVQTNGGRSTTTGSDGVYRLIGLPAGTYRVTPVQSGLVFQPSFRDVAVTNGDVGGNDFQISVSSFSIQGQVRTKRGGQGVRNALVRAGPNYSATTDNSGNYRLDSVPAGNYTLTVSHNDYSFDPPQIALALSGNRSGQNFQAIDINRVYVAGAGFAPLGQCFPDAYEPNDVREDPLNNLQNSRLVSGVQIVANLCDAPNPEKDHFLFHVNNPASLQLQIRFPQNFAPVGVTLYYVDYDEPQDTKLICHTGEVTAEVWTPSLCPNPNAVFSASGDYVLRLYIDKLETLPVGNYSVLATFN